MCVPGLLANYNYLVRHPVARVGFHVYDSQASACILVNLEFGDAMTALAVITSSTLDLLLPRCDSGATTFLLTSSAYLPPTVTQSDGTGDGFNGILAGWKAGSLRRGRYPFPDRMYSSTTPLSPSISLLSLRLNQPSLVPFNPPSK